MSPELLHPGLFDIKDSRPTKESDSYALGMVILEVLSGHPPFKGFGGVDVIRMVTGGERPERPTGSERVWFTDKLWRVLTQCWESERDSRPGIDAIFECLEGVSSSWEPLPLQPDGEVGEEGQDTITASDSSGTVI